MATAVDFPTNSFPISQGYRWLPAGVYVQDDCRVNPKLVPIKPLNVRRGTGPMGGQLGAHRRSEGRPHKNDCAARA